MAAVLAEEAELDVRIPFAVADPLAQIVDHAGKAVADDVARTVLEFALDFVAEFVGDDFVGIDEEDPRVLGQGADVVFLGDVAFPGVLVDAGQCTAWQISKVLSRLKESTTTISSHHSRLARQAAILSSSLPAVTQAEIFR